MTLVAVLLGRLVVPVDDERLADALAVLGEEARTLGSDGDDLAVLDELHALALALEGGDRRSEEGLAVGGLNDERALEAGADEQARVGSVDHDEHEVALELGIRLLDGSDEVARVVGLDKMDDHLCVGLGREHVWPASRSRSLSSTKFSTIPFRTTATSSSAAGQRMRVLDRDPAVRGPARVPDPGGRVRAVPAGRRLELVEVAGADVVEAFVLEEGEPGRVVAAVLEPLEAAEQETLRRDASRRIR